MISYTSRAIAPTQDEPKLELGTRNSAPDRGTEEHAEWIAQLAREQKERFAREGIPPRITVPSNTLDEILAALPDRMDEGEAAINDKWVKLMRSDILPPEREDCGEKPLPAIESAAARLQRHKTDTAPEVLVEGVLHRQELLMLSGASKAAKSWAALDLGVSVNAGLPFWGMKTARGRVLFLNYEIDDYHFDERLGAVASARGASVDNLDVLNLQRHWGEFERVRDYIIFNLKEAMAEGNPYALIIIDPLYSLLEGKNENDNAEMAKMLQGIKIIAYETGAAITAVHHFAKGNSAVKSSIDRASGAGVFGRYPDNIITLDRHKEGNGRVAEFTARAFPERAKLGLRFEHPLLVVDNELNTRAIQGSKTGGEAFASLPDFIAIARDLGGEGGEISSLELRQTAAARFGYTKDGSPNPEASSLYKFITQAKKTGSLEDAGRGKMRIRPS